MVTKEIKKLSTWFVPTQRGVICTAQMSGFEPPTGRRSHMEGFVPPNRQQHIPRPPIKHFSSGNSQENLNPGTPTQPQTQPSSGGGLSFFSFRKRSNPPASPVAETTSSNHSSTSPAHQNGSQTSVTAPPHPRRLSSKELAPVGSSGAMSSANTSSSHEVMLVDPYSMPREVPDIKPTTPTPTPTSPPPPQQRPTHSSSLSFSSIASGATTVTTRSRPLHPELRSLIALNAARKC